MAVCDWPLLSTPADRHPVARMVPVDEAAERGRPVDGRPAQRLDDVTGGQPSRLRRRTGLEVQYQRAAQPLEGYQRDPLPVMVWTPTQTGAFLDHTAATDDDWYALYHLVAYRRLRRGEACGLHWTDIDLDAAQLTVRCQLAQLGWATSLKAPKTDSSEGDIVALDTDTVAVLRAARRVSEP